MTGGADPRTQALLAQAALFDEPTLQHLTNRGLVRRAGKLLSGGSSGTTVGVTESTDGLTVSSTDWTVSFFWDSPLPEGRCDCATAGVCQHVLAAIIYLGTLGSQEPQPSVGDSLFQITDEELLAWAKKANSRWALERVDSIERGQTVIEDGPYLNVILPPPYGDIRFMGPTLDEAIVKPATSHDRRVITLGLLAYWLSRGRDLPMLTGPATKPTELVSERMVLARRAGRLCEDLITVGLLHVGPAERERLDSLAASARGVKLYRLALLAERASDNIDALQVLSADADTARLMDHLSEIAVIAVAMADLLSAGRALPIGLQGSARARYQTVGHLDLACIGYYEWGDNRFSGSTGVFAQSANLIYTVSKPRVVNGRRLSEALDWEGGGSLASLAGRRVSLFNAQASDSMRLSGGGSVTAAPGPEITGADLAPLVWSGELPPTPSRLLGVTAVTWVVLKIEREQSPISFDPIGQRSEWSLQSNGQTINVRLPYRPASAVAVQNLELQAEQGVPEFIAGRLRRVGDGLELWPVATFSDDRFRNLATPGPIEPSGRNTPPSAETEQTPALQLDHGGVEPPSHLDRLSARIVRLADGGQRPGTKADLTRLATDSENWGFASLAETISNAPNPAVGLVRGWWVAKIIQDLDGGGL